MFPGASTLALFAVLFHTAHGRAVPTAPQLHWGGRQGAIIHYNIATFAHHQGCGRANWVATRDPMTFGTGLPADGIVDTDSWGRAMVAANITYAVYVAKHNCGFTTWPTAVKLPNGEPYRYSVQYSSCPTCNVVRDFLATCKKYGIKAGFYYSIATNTYLNVQSRNVQPNPLPGMVPVTQAEFYAIALAQLEELWSLAQGELFEIWFDGGLPSDPVFGAGISSLLSKLQPNAATFNSWPIVNSTAIRWIGTEGGAAPDPTWSSGSCGRGNEQCTDCAGGNGGAPDDADWCAAEVDSTLQLGDTWFYVAGLGLHPLSDLQASYHASLGRNSNWLLDIAPPPSGTVAPAHAALYSEFGAWLRGCYGAVPVARGSFAPGARALSIALPAGARFDRVRLTEDVTGGQFVRAYTVESTGPPRAGAGPPGRAVCNGTSIGTGKIDLLPAPLSLGPDASVLVSVDTAPTGLTVELFMCAQ